MKIIKKLGIIVIFTGLSTAWSQEGFQFGFDVTPSWKLNTHNSKIVKGIRSAENGYGFSIGFPLKYWLKENLAINSGVLYEFTAFDRFTNGVLINSQRFSAIQVPIMVHIRIRNELFFTAGGGADYIFAAKRLDLGLSVNIDDRLRRFQPFLGAGVNFFKPRDIGALEIGAQVRFFILDLWNKNEPTFASTSSRLLTFDLLLRYYL